MTRNVARVLDQVQPSILELGICKSEAAERDLMDYGIPEKDIWMMGRGHETIEEAIYRCRNEPAVFVISEDLRLLGSTQATIFARVSELSKLNITFLDLNYPNDDIHALEHRAFKALHSGAAIRNHRTARRRGSLGGTAKAIAEKARRAAQVSDDIAIKICTHKKLTWPDRAAILGMAISTIQRHYGA